MKFIAAAVLLVTSTVSAFGQAPAMTEVSAPEFVPLIKAVPLQMGLAVSVEWVSLRGRARLYECTVVEANANSAAYRTTHNGVMHTITDRVTSEYYTGNWSESRDDMLPHTWPWIPLAVAEQLAQGQPGETKVRLGDLLAREMREYLLVDKRTVPLMSEHQPVLAPCWVLVAGNGSALSVLADPQNPLVMESYEPGVSMQRALEIGGVDLEFEALAPQ